MLQIYYGVVFFNLFEYSETYSFFYEHCDHSRIYDCYFS